MSSIISYGQTNINIPSTGEKQDSVLVAVSTLKEATIKLLEREEYIKLNAQKDSIILDYKDLVSNQEENINYLIGEISVWKDKADNYEDLNKRLSKNLQTQKVISYVAGGVALTTTISLIISLVIQ